MNWNWDMFFQTWIKALLKTAAIILAVMSGVGMTLFFFGKPEYRVGNMTILIVLAFLSAICEIIYEIL